MKNLGSVRVRIAPDGFVEIRLDGTNSHLDAKALQHLIGRVIGRGKAEGRIGQTNVRILVSNDGTEGAGHTAIEER